MLLFAGGATMEEAVKQYIPVLYKDVIWYSQACLRLSLLKELRRINPKYRIFIYNKTTKETKDVALGELWI